MPPGEASLAHLARKEGLPEHSACSEADHHSWKSALVRKQVASNPKVLQGYLYAH